MENIKKQKLLELNYSKRLNPESWINKAKDIHGDKFDYSLTKYINATTKLDIICPIHGLQTMLPHHHLQGYGCGKCGKEQINKSNGRQLSTESFIEKIKEFNLNLSFEKTIYKSKRSSLIVTCPIHGDYETKGEILLKGHGCRKCSSVNSKGEKFIEEFLLKRDIIFISQMKFKNFTSINGVPYQFDFYIPSINTCIEFDGKQHFEPVEYWGGQEGLERRKRSDEIKNKFCTDNNINLIRISYNEDIEERLKNIVSK